jgi:hypothetical protein
LSVKIKNIICCELQVSPRLQTNQYDQQTVSPRPLDKTSAWNHGQSGSITNMKSIQTTARVSSILAQHIRQKSIQYSPSRRAKVKAIDEKESREDRDHPLMCSHSIAAVYPNKSLRKRRPGSVKIHLMRRSRSFPLRTPYTPQLQDDSFCYWYILASYRCKMSRRGIARVS